MPNIGLRISMDLETENRLAALLMEEARRLRREADKEGVHVYLQKPNIRGRPNSRFLTATVLGVEQANRAAEISEMWRAREKERELDAKQRCEAKDKNTGMHARNDYLKGDYRSRHEENSAVSIFRLNKHRKVNSPCRGTQSSDDNEPLDSPLHCSSSKLYHEDSHSSDDTGLQDDEIEEFLHSRMKRGRGSVGCRMDDPGPYLHPSSANLDEHVLNPSERVEERERRILCFPKKPYFLESEKNHSKNWKIFEGEKSECKRRNDKKAKHQKKLRAGRHSTESKPKARHQ